VGLALLGIYLGMGSQPSRPATAVQRPPTRANNQ
jgi:hypothetical protein